jgi:hypothetical protein
MTTPKNVSRRPALHLVKEPSPMARLRHRVMVLEGQMNAIAQAWLYLSAEMEMQGGISLERMETALQHKYWPEEPDVSAEGQRTLQWLCRELSAARNVRASRKRDGEEV